MTTACSYLMGQVNITRMLVRRMYARTTVGSMGNEQQKLKVWVQLQDCKLIDVSYGGIAQKTGVLLFWFGCDQQQKHHTAAPPPTAMRRRMERNREKLVGRDKGSLTEQQTKGTATTKIQKRGIHKTNQQKRACRTQPLCPGPNRRCALPSRK